tara:strand:+ start:501 stop:1154 length:654 start_codon:yes stop_codon:yes gene_type:complete
MYYLYLKTSPSGLKYLGKFTTRSNRPNFTVYDYLGSGTIWNQHIKKHNLTAKDIITEVLLQTEDYEELKRVAMEYSNKLQVAESKSFANAVPEDGCCPIKYCDFSKRATPEYRSKISAALKGKPKSKEHRVNMKTFEKGNTPWNKGIKALYSRSEETKQKMSEAHKERLLKKFRERFDPIAKVLILDIETLGSIQKVKEKYNISFNTIKKIIQIYGK